jgi:hypothetical protein
LLAGRGQTPELFSTNRLCCSARMGGSNGTQCVARAVAIETCSHSKTTYRLTIVLVMPLRRRCADKGEENDVQGGMGAGKWHRYCARCDWGSQLWRRGGKRGGRSNDLLICSSSRNGRLVPFSVGWCVVRAPPEIGCCGLVDRAV